MDIERLRSLLGAGPPTGTEQVTLFVPSVTRDGTPIDQEYWREETLATFGKLFRGATAYPPGRGVWRDDDQAGRLVYDDTVIVFSIVEDAILNDGRVMGELAYFLRRLRVEADQGEVGLLIGDYYLGITQEPEDWMVGDGQT